MSADEKFPLCRKAGLEVYRVGPPKYNCVFQHEVVHAEKVEALLANAPVVYGVEDLDRMGWNKTKYDMQTHSARLLLIEPIQQKSREDEMEELLNTFVERTKHYGGDWDLVEQAKKILNKRKK